MKIGRVFFGHQSVGANIVDGVRELMEPSATCPVVGVADIPPGVESFLAHCLIGRNGDPASKTQAFTDIVSSGAGAAIDLALHKYCYADIDANTDARTVFARYRDAMRALAVRRPSVLLGHMTVPLVRVRTGPRAWAQQVLGRTSPRIADNANREVFNDLLRREYAGREPLFDLADLESVATGASSPKVTSRSLRASYTDDGGHLNALGRRHVAREFLTFLHNGMKAAASRQPA